MGHVDVSTTIADSMSQQSDWGYYLLSLRGCRETWELHKLTGSGGMLFLIVFNQLSEEHSFFLAQGRRPELENDLSMKIMSETRERRCNISPHAKY